MDQTLAIMGISATTLVAIFLAEMDASIQKRGGIWFLRFGRLRISFCRTRNHNQELNA